MSRADDKTIQNLEQRINRLKAAFDFKNSGLKTPLRRRVNKRRKAGEISDVSYFLSTYAALSALDIEERWLLKSYFADVFREDGGSPIELPEAFSLDRDVLLVVCEDFSRDKESLTVQPETHILKDFQEFLN